MNSPDNKVMPLGEAVRRYVKPGAHISVGGFTLNRSPMAAVYEIIRQGIKGLHVYAHSNGQAVDELIGAGCVSRLEIAYGGTGKYAATCIRFRRAVQNGDIVFCGTGISMLAAMAAKNINAPQSVIFFETGAVDSLLEELPLAVADPRIMYWSAGNTGLLDAFAVMQNRITGNKVIAILGAAQIDKYGNLNTTCIGNYHRPQIRFSGSGGGCDVASFVPRVIAFMQHERRKFVKKLDYLTSPGQLDGSGSREQAGLRPGGVSLVVTNLAVIRFDRPSGQMYLDQYYPGVSVEQILDNMGFAVDVSRAVQASPPTPEELAVLRGKCDPQRLILD